MFVQALRMTARDWRAGELRFLLVALIVAVAALTSVGFFTDRMRAGMDRDAHQLLGADLLVKTDDPVPQAWRDEAARRGLDAEILWLDGRGKRPIREVLRELIPIAAEGLAAQGMDQDLIDHYLDIISCRLASGCNGAEWQLAHFRRYRDLHKLTAAYVENQRTGRPVHEWPV